MGYKINGVVFRPIECPIGHAQLLSYLPALSIQLYEQEQIDNERVRMVLIPTFHPSISASSRQPSSQFAL